MIKDLEKVYGWLSDSKSKEIFINRLNFSVTKDFKYILNIVENNSEEINGGFSWKDLIKSIKSLSDDTKVIICGAGGGGIALYSVLKSENIKIDSFCDRNKNLNGKREVPVISYEMLFDRYKSGEKIAIVIGTEIYFSEVYETLISNGIKEKDIYGGGANINLQYFEKELLGLKDEEYFVDCGALDLQTTKYFLDVCPDGKAYAFEPDKYNFDRCINMKKENNLDTVAVYNYGCGSKEKTLKFSSIQGGSSTVSNDGDTEISIVPLDKILKDKEVTFIKMDIEGMELDALEGAKEIIKSKKPKLAISIYHKDEDILTIPKFIKELVPEYKFYIRHYSVYQYETILYAVI